jgi:hypothetical protein
LLVLCSSGKIVGYLKGALLRIPVTLGLLIVSCFAFAFSSFSTSNNSPQAVSGSYSVQIPANQTGIVALPPVQGGVIPFGRIFFSLASDFDGATVRLAVGKPGDFRVQDNLEVPAGRNFIEELVPDDEIISVINRGPQPVAVLVEYQGLLVKYQSWDDLSKSSQS